MVSVNRLFDVLPNAVVAIDEKGSIHQVNGRLQQLFGYSRESLIGQPVEVLLPDRFRSHHQKHFETYAGNAEQRLMGLAGRELFGLHDNGDEFPVEVALTSIEDDGKHYLIASILDMRERVATEKNLRESELKFQLAMKYAPIGMALVGLKGQFLEVNPAMCRIVGYSESCYHVISSH